MEGSFFYGRGKEAKSRDVKNNYNICVIRISWRHEGCYPGCQRLFMHGFRFQSKVLKSDLHEKPLDQSAIPLIVPSKLEPRLYQNIQNLDVVLGDTFCLFLGDIECFKCSDWITISIGT